LKAYSEASLKALKDEKAKAVKEIGKHKSEVEGLAKRIVADEGGKRAKPIRRNRAFGEGCRKTYGRKGVYGTCGKEHLKQLQH